MKECKIKRRTTILPRLKTFKIELAWAEEVVYQIVQCAIDCGWVFSIDELNNSLYYNPSWTCIGDQLMTIVAADVFVTEVMDALKSVATVNGDDFTVDLKGKLVAVEGQKIACV